MVAPGRVPRRWERGRWGVAFVPVALGKIPPRAYAPRTEFVPCWLDFPASVASPRRKVSHEEHVTDERGKVVGTKMSPCCNCRTLFSLP